jgi:hypothetical protein
MLLTYYEKTEWQMNFHINIKKTRMWALFLIKH